MSCTMHTPHLARALCRCFSCQFDSTQDMQRSPICRLRPPLDIVRERHPRGQTASSASLIGPERKCRYCQVQLHVQCQFVTYSSYYLISVHKGHLLCMLASQLTCEHFASILHAWCTLHSILGDSCSILDHCSTRDVAKKQM